MSRDYGTVMLTIDPGVYPDWDALDQLIEDVEITAEHREEFEGYLSGSRALTRRFSAEDGTPAEQARKELRDAALALRTAWNDGAGSSVYEIRQVRGCGRGIDCHILYDDPDDPVELWHHHAVLEQYVPGVFEIAGFDPDPTKDSVSDIVTCLPLTQPEVQSLSEALHDTIEENRDPDDVAEPHMLEYADRLDGIRKRLVGVEP